MAVKGLNHSTEEEKNLSFKPRLAGWKDCWTLSTPYRGSCFLVWVFIQVKKSLMWINFIIQNTHCLPLPSSSVRSSPALPPWCPQCVAKPLLQHGHRWRPGVSAGPGHRWLCMHTPAQRISPVPWKRSIGSNTLQSAQTCFAYIHQCNTCTVCLCWNTTQCQFTLNTKATGPDIATC